MVARAKTSKKPSRNGKVRRMAEEPIARASSGGPQRLIPQNFYQEWTRAAVAILHDTYDFNPDDLIVAKGVGAKIYQDMIRDPYVKAGVAIKKLSVSRLPTHVLPASNSPEDQKIARFCEYNLENMETPWHDFLWGIMDAVNIGYSIGEMNYRLIDRGEWSGKVGIKSVKGKDPYVYTFKVTDFGDIEAVIQRIGSLFVSNQGWRGQYFEPSKFLIASFQPLYNNPYGSSDFRAAYRAFFIKDWSWKFRSIFLEKWGMPTAVGKFPNGTVESRRQDLENALASIQNDTVITIPDDMQVDLLRVANSGNITEYERCIADLNKEILVGLIGSFLAVEEGRRTGARAAGQVHFDVNKLFIEALVSLVEEVINRQYIRRIVDMNFVVEKYPKVKFQLSHVDEYLSEATLDKMLAEMGVQSDRQYYYGKYGRPTPAGGEVRRIGPDPEFVKNGIPGFEKMRKTVIPEDKEKIGPLREMYEWVVRYSDAVRGLAPSRDREKIAFDLAGQERDHVKTYGEWMDGSEAERRLVIRLERA